jgi:hypothetical protein
MHRQIISICYGAQPYICPERYLLDSPIGQRVRHSPGTDLDSAAVRNDFDAVADWADQRGITVFMGEFGVYSRSAMDDRVAWTGFVVREAERRGFSWAYWEFDARLRSLHERAVERTT